MKRSLRYSLKALEGLTNIKDMESVFDLPPSIKIMLKDKSNLIDLKEKFEEKKVFYYLI